MVAVSGSTLGGGITVTVEAARERATRESRWLTRGGSLLGGTIAGLAANIIGGAYPLASTLGIAIAVVFVAVIAIQLRRLPVQAPIHRLVARVGLGGAALAVVASLLVPPNWTGWTVLLSAALGMAGSLTPTSTDDTFIQLTGAAAVATGVAAVGFGVGFMLRSDLLVGVAMIGVGLAGVGLAVSVLLRSELLGGVAAIGFGVAIIGLGVSVLLRSNLLIGAAAIGCGVAMIGFGVGFLLRSNLLVGVAVIGIAVAMIGGGVLRVSPPLIIRIRRLVSDPQQS